MKQAKVEPSPNSEFAARSKFAKTVAAKPAIAKTDIERKVVKCYGVLEIAELNFTPGREFGKAVIELRDEIKKNGRRNFMTRLKELAIPYAKARYWMAIVEEKPIHRGKAKHAAKAGDSAKAQEKATVAWQEDWSAAKARFKQVTDAVIVLVERHPERRESFIGELRNLVEFLGYELRPKRGEIGVLQRVQPTGSGVAA